MAKFKISFDGAKPITVRARNKREAEKFSDRWDIKKIQKVV